MAAKSRKRVLWSLFGVLIGGLFLGAVAIWRLGCEIREAFEPKIILHTAKVDWLPASATDISTYTLSAMGGWSESLEATLPEADFRRLADQEGWTLEEKWNFDGLSLIGTRIPGLPPLRPASGDAEASEIMPHALVCDRRDWAAGGAGQTILFDVELNRLLYTASNH